MHLNIKDLRPITKKFFSFSKTKQPMTSKNSKTTKIPKNLTKLPKTQEKPDKNHSNTRDQ
jgi:hypothetical protein